MASHPHDLVLMEISIFILNPRHLMLRQLTGILESFIPDQYVNFPTRIRGHSLNLMIFSIGCDVLSVSTSDMSSDHFSVIADLNITTDHTHSEPQAITYRKLRAINIEAFKANITNSELISNPKTSATDLAQQYDSVLSTLIDLHTPLVTKMISPQASQPMDDS